jgi:hypothetical protein
LTILEWSARISILLTDFDTEHTADDRGTMQINAPERSNLPSGVFFVKSVFFQKLNSCCSHQYASTYLDGIRVFPFVERYDNRAFHAFVADLKVVLQCKEIFGFGAESLEKVLVPISLHQRLDTPRVEPIMRDSKEQHTDA